MTYRYFRARTYGKARTMVVHLPAIPHKNLEARKEIHFGYVYEEMFWYESSGGTTFAQPMSNCVPASTSS